MTLMNYFMLGFAHLLTLEVRNMSRNKLYRL